ncbi:MAG: phosphotransferase [Bacillota bacterium]|nr:phosphotransferase [Bacillota bacterium]
MTESQPALETMAAKVLARYGIGRYTARLIRHNENAAFDVSDLATGARYLLRVHRPVSPSILGIQHMFEGLTSEAYILQQFREGTGLPLQQPVRSRAGMYVTLVDHPEDHTSCPCTLLTWVEGEVLDQGHTAAPELVRGLGQVAARMNAFARRWEPDRPLIRPVYDAGKYRHLVARIATGLELGLFNAAHHSLVLAAMRRIETLFAETPRDRDCWGIIHADLKPDNVIVAEVDADAADADSGPVRERERLVPIDFCFAGYGYYMFDVGGVLPALNTHLRGAFLEGYQEVLGPLSAADIELANACFLLSIFGGVGFSMNRAGAHEWIKRRMPVWAGEYCRRYLDGESLLLIQL